MTTELFYLNLTALMAATLWLPFIIGLSKEPEDYTDFTRPPDLTQVTPWVHRAFRAHLNLLETLLPFAIVVVIAHLANVSTSVTLFAATAFFWLRVVHAIGMISGLAIFPYRPIIFSASWACTISIGIVVVFS